MLNLFNNTTNATPGLPFDSNSIVPQTDGSISVSSGTVVKNGVDVGASASFLSGDVLKLRLTADASYGRAMHTVYTFNGDVGTWSVATPREEAQYPYQFAVLDKARIARNTTIQSSPVSLYRLTAPLQVSVPNVFSATLLKNGVDVGRSAFFNNNDQFQVQFVSPSDYDYQVSIPIFAGNYFDTFDALTVSEDIHPDAVHFTHVSGATISTAYTSDEVAVTGIDSGRTITASVTNATLIVNGTDTGLSNTVVGVNDRIKLKATSAVYSLETVHCVLTLGDAQAAWSIANQELAKHYLVKASDKTRLVFDTAFTPDNSHNAIFKITSTLVETQYAFGTPTNSYTQVDHLLVADTLNDAVYVFGTDGTALKKIALTAGSKPYMIAYAPKTAYVDTTTKRLVTCHGTNKVAVLDPDNNYAVSYVTVGNAPAGILSLDDGTTYVANSADGTVSVLTWNGSSFTVTATLSIGGRPFDFAVDAFNNVYVSDFANGRVVKITGTITYDIFTVGNNPMGMAIKGTTLYVCNSYDNTISVINLTTKTVDSTIKTLSMPVNCDINGNYMAVVHMGVSKLLRIDLTTLAQTEISKSYQLYGCGYDSTGNLWVVQLYSNTPTFVAAFTQPTVTVDDTVDVVRQAYVDTPIVFTPTNTRTRAISVPGLRNTGLLKNGAQPGQSNLTQTTFVQGDTFKVHVPASDQYYETIYTPVVVGSQVYEFSVRSEPKLVPDTMYFQATYNVEVGVAVQSTAVQVTGLTPGYSCDLSYANAHGTIIKNGIDTGSVLVSVTNGDTIAMTTEVQGPYGMPSVYHIGVGESDVGSWKVVPVILTGAVKNIADADHSNDEDTNFVKGVYHDEYDVSMSGTKAEGNFPQATVGGYDVLGRGAFGEAEMPLASRLQQAVMLAQGMTATACPAYRIAGASLRPVMFKYTVKLAQYEGGLSAIDGVSNAAHGWNNFDSYATHFTPLSQAMFASHSEANSTTPPGAYEFRFGCTANTLNYDHAYKVTAEQSPDLADKFADTSWARPELYSGAPANIYYTRPELYSGADTATYYDRGVFTSWYETVTGWTRTLLSFKEFPSYSVKGGLFYVGYAAETIFQCRPTATSVPSPELIAVPADVATRVLSEIVYGTKGSSSLYVGPDMVGVLAQRPTHKTFTAAPVKTSRAYHLASRVSFKHTFLVQTCDGAGESCRAKGMYQNAGAAGAAAIAAGYLSYETYQIGTCWMYRTPSTPIVCEVPDGGRIPMAGHIQGG